LLSHPFNEKEKISYLAWEKLLPYLILKLKIFLILVCHIFHLLFPICHFCYFLSF
jgi:hypothetical protein